jgi:hypothetical protein
MFEERITESPSWSDPRGQGMKTPDDVEAMLRLKACGWGMKRIAAELGCSHHTVKTYVAAGGVVPFKSPERAKVLDGQDDWLRERFVRLRIPAKTTTHSDAWRPPVPIDDDQCGAGAGEHRWMALLISVFAFHVNLALTTFESRGFENVDPRPILAVMERECENAASLEFTTRFLPAIGKQPPVEAVRVIWISSLVRNDL